MSDDDDLSIGEMYSFLKKEDQYERQARRDSAEQEFEHARMCAERHGMRLIRHSDAHYALHCGWILDIYPGNQRLYRPDRLPRVPFLKLPEDRDWTLLDVVLAAAQ